MQTIILAGGKSSRMGQNKAMMRIGGVPVIDRIAAEFAPVSQKMIIIANDPEPYKNMKAVIYQDDPQYKRQGPLAGIYTGLKEAGEGPCLIVACDMPFASLKLGSTLISELKKYDYDAVIPIQQGQIHPLFGAYHSRIADEAKKTLEDGKRAVKALLDRIHVNYYTMDEETDAVWNMNTMDDYIKAAEAFERRE